MLKCFCDKCGKELTTGYMEIGASYSHDPSPEAPGHVMGWDVCQDCFSTLGLKISEMAAELSGMKKVDDREVS